MAKKIFNFLAFLLLAGCAATWKAPSEFTYVPIKTKNYEIATWQKITDSDSDIHIYIEGDGRAFYADGRPTGDPTPRGVFLRNLVGSDSAPNVVYIARPCQYIMSDSCSQTDWTTGRFSAKVISSMGQVIKKVAENRPIILIGYSGGAMVSGLVIKENPDLDIKKWITIAGVLDHTAWTKFFGDAPLTDSLDLGKLPTVPQLHYVAENDEVVPRQLTEEIVPNRNIVIVSDATHTKFPDLKLDFSY